MRRRAKIGQEPWFKQSYYDREEQYRAFTGAPENPAYLHTPGITQGIRPGIGQQHQYCDCAAPDKVSSHFVTILVSVQYLSLMCMKYCAVLSGLRRRWRPEYMPSSTVGTTTMTISTTTSTTTTAIIESLQSTFTTEDEQNFSPPPSPQSNDDFTSLFLNPTDAGRWRSLSCPNYCSAVVDPICGSDGVIYKNDCDRRKRTCGTAVEKVDLEQCTIHNGANCKHECDKEKDMVCGTDGRTYLNKCYLQVEYCSRGIEFSHYGPCMNSSAPTETCPSSCARSLLSGAVCGSDGNVYPSECDMKRETCGQGVVAVDRRHCQTTEHCDAGCWRISRLTCGSDGKLYNNGCQMHRKNCGRHVYEMPVPFCLNKMYRTDCPMDCSDEATEPTCGSDGNIYRNDCELKKMTCGFPLTRYELITAVSFKNCASKNAMCDKLICSNEYSPVCGNDAITYDNMCHLQKATCMTGIQLAHAGECVKHPHKKEICPRNCEKAEKKIVCGSDGNAYRSQCEMKRRTCGQKVVEAPYSHCKATQYCQRGLKCPQTQKKMICGSDGQFYPSQCEMHRENCGKHMYVAPISECLRNFKFLFNGCGRVCSDEYDPVCGTDLKTYSNQCFMEMENCRARSLGGVQRKYYGKCGEPRQSPRHYLYRKRR